MSALHRIDKNVQFMIERDTWRIASYDNNILDSFSLLLHFLGTEVSVWVPA